MSLPKPAESRAERAIDSFPEFAIDRPLRPCVLTRDLLAQIEKYLVSTERDLFAELSNRNERKFDLSVHDAFGVETFSSASEIPTTGFPETTEVVRLIQETTTEPSDTAIAAIRYLKIKLTFRNRHGNRIVVRIRGPHARERVIGLIDRIEQLVQSEALGPKFLTNQQWITSGAGVLAGFGGLFWLLVTYGNLTAEPATAPTETYLIWTAVIATAAAYWVFSRLFIPPCAFETRRWSKIQEWRSWAKFGLASVFLLDGLAFTAWSHLVRFLGPQI
jgi:hypothetical protein